MISLSLSRRAFTLIEMLVATAIMSFMLIVMAQITGITEQTWHLEQDRIDNFTKARSMLDLITDDLQRAVFRGDLPAFGTGAPSTTPVTNGTGSLFYFSQTKPAIAFYTRMAGVSATATQVRDISLVSYALTLTNQSADKIVLQRSDLNVPWTNAQNLAFQGDMSPLLQSADTTQLSAASGVVGFRLAFRRADGSVIDQTNYTGYNTTNPVVAVNVGLAVIGKNSLALLNGSQILNIQTALANSSITNGVKASWDQGTLTSGFYAQYPGYLGNDLKTFERWVACPAF